jgi:hypothetical protein
MWPALVVLVFCSKQKLVTNKKAYMYTIENLIGLHFCQPNFLYPEQRKIIFVKIQSVKNDFHMHLLLLKATFKYM